MTTATVKVVQHITVSIDEEKLTPEFMEEFRNLLYPFYTVEEHLEHLAQLYARGLTDNRSFIEGYGPAPELGITFCDEGIVELEIAERPS